MTYVSLKRFFINKNSYCGKNFIVLKSERKTITKAQIHKNKNRQKSLDMDSLDGLMYKAKEVHSPSNEKENCKEDNEEMKREDLKQEIMVQYISFLSFIFSLSLDGCSCSLLLLAKQPL